MVFKNEESVDAIKDNFVPPAAKGEEMYDKDGDGQESVSEYIEKKKMSSDAKKGEEDEKKEKKDKSKEDLEKLGNAVRTGASVVSSIPHFAAFGLGLGTGGLAGIMKDMLTGKK